jgi:hypothetical protein
LQITGLSRPLFADVLKRIAIAKFPDAPTEAQAYKYLVEKHIALGARRANEDVKEFEDVIRKSCGLMIHRARNTDFGSAQN